MSIWQSIFGSGDVIKSGIDLIDGFHTSETEMIEAKTEAKVKHLQAYAPFKLAQRILALMFVGTFLVSFFICLIFTLCYIFGAVVAAPGIEPTDEILALLDSFYIGEITLTITVFYFGGGFLEGTITAARSKQKSGDKP